MLAAAGIEFEAVASGFDEGSVRHLSARSQARAAARGKAAAVADRHPGRWVLGADTVVAVAGRVLGQPADRAEAAAMLRLLQGREHSVISSIAVAAPDGDIAEAIAVARVAMASLTPAEIRAYVATGEPFDKAGAYAIQGQAGAFVSLLSGGVDTVIGLPVKRVKAALRSLGYPVAERPSGRLGAPGPGSRTGKRATRNPGRAASPASAP